MRRNKKSSNSSNKTKTNSSPQPSSQQTVRIIGGKWGSRKLPFPNVDGLRPTGDRIRETAFNWLNPRLYNARCLDLYAGSGALGFEALSRGAAFCHFLDTSSAVISQLTKNSALLQANAHIHKTSAIDWLATQTESFDLIFLDPPFQDQLWQQSLDSIFTHNLIHEDGRIYFEANKKQALPTLPSDWEFIRHKQTGDLQFGLIAKTA